MVQAGGCDEGGVEWAGKWVCACGCAGECIGCWLAALVGKEPPTHMLTFPNKSTSSLPCSLHCCASTAHLMLLPLRTLPCRAETSTPLLLLLLLLLLMHAGAEAGVSAGCSAAGGVRLRGDSGRDPEQPLPRHGGGVQASATGVMPCYLLATRARKHARVLTTNTNTFPSRPPHRYLGLECHMILRNSAALADSDPGLVGNLLVDRMVGAHIHQVRAATKFTNWGCDWRLDSRDEVGFAVMGAHIQQVCSDNWGSPQGLVSLPSTFTACKVGSGLLIPYFPHSYCN